LLTFSVYNKYILLHEWEGSAGGIFGLRLAVLARP